MKTETRVPLSRPYIDEREEELVLDVLRSGRLSLGPAIEPSLSCILGLDRRKRSDGAMIRWMRYVTGNPRSRIRLRMA